MCSTLNTVTNKQPTFNIPRGRCYLMLSLPSLLSIFREDVMHRANPMLRWVPINPLASLFQLWSTIFLSWLSTQLSFAFQPPIFYILAMATIYSEKGIYKPTLILYLSFLLSYALSSASALGIYTPTPLLYSSFLNCVQALKSIFEFSS